MSAVDSILVFLIIVVVLLVIGIVFIFLNASRTRNRANPGSRQDAGGSIQGQDKQIANRLGVRGSIKKGVDPRGEDVGGNYSRSTTADETTKGS